MGVSVVTKETSHLFTDADTWNVDDLEHLHVERNDEEVARFRQWISVMKVGEYK